MPDLLNECKEKIIRQLLKVQAQVTVTPLITHGEPTVNCVSSCINPNPDYCEHKDNNYDYNDFCNNYDCNTSCDSHKHKCNFTLTQLICIEIPISIDAVVDIKEGIVCCGRPDVKSIEDINIDKAFYIHRY